MVNSRATHARSLLPVALAYVLCCICVGIFEFGHEATMNYYNTSF